MYKVSVNGKQLQVADYPGEKGPIIAIHGLTGTHKNMHYYADAFKGEYRFIAVDLRGRGNSDDMDDNQSIFNHAADILALIEKLNISEPIILGHSMGAYISSIVASKLASVKGLILLDGAGNMKRDRKEIVKPSLGRLSKRYDSKEHFLEEIKNIYKNLDIEWNDTLQQTVEYEFEKVGNHWEHKSDEEKIVADFDSFDDYSPKEIFSKIECPILLVYAKSAIGSMPPLFELEDYKETQEYAKNLKTVISDCNHYTMVFENREDINHEIRNFLNNLS